MSDINKKDENIQENSNTEQNESSENNQQSNTNDNLSEQQVNDMDNTEELLAEVGINLDDIEEFGLIPDPDELKVSDDENNTNKDEDFVVGAWKRPDKHVTEESTNTVSDDDSSQTDEQPADEITDTVVSDDSSESNEQPTDVVAETVADEVSSGVNEQPTNETTDTVANEVSSGANEQPTNETTDTVASDDSSESNEQPTSEATDTLASDDSSESNEQPADEVTETVTTETTSTTNGSTSAVDTTQKETSADDDTLTEEMPVTTSAFKANEAEDLINNEDVSSTQNIDTPVNGDIDSIFNTPIAEDIDSSLDTPIAENIEPSLDTPIAEDVEPNLDFPLNSAEEPVFTTPDIDEFEAALDTPVTDDIADSFNSSSNPNETIDASAPKDSTKGMTKKMKKEKTEETLKEKKPLNKGFVIIAAVLGVMFVLGGVAFFLLHNPTTRNSLMATFMKPKQYYMAVEGNNLKSSLEGLPESDLVKTMTAIQEKSDSLNNSVSINLSDNLTSMVSTLLGNYGSLATSIKSINIKTDYLKQKENDKSKHSATLEIGLNNNSIITMDVIIDPDSNAIYLQCPTVFKRWIKIPVSKDVIKALCSNDKKEPTPEDIATICEKYVPILLGNFNDLKLSKNTTFSVNDTKVEVNKFTINLDEKNYNQIIKKFTDELKKDDLVYSYAKSYGVADTKKEYEKAIDDMFDLSNDKKDTKENAKQDKKDKETIFPIVMNIYADKKGVIVARDFKIGKKGDAKVSMAYYDTGDVAKYEVSAVNKSDEVLVSGNIKDNNKTYSGLATITSTVDISGLKDLLSLFSASSKSETALVDPTAQSKTQDKTSDKDKEALQTFKFKVNYENIKFVDPNNGLYQGKVTITPDGIKNLTGSSIIFDYGIKSGNQTAKTTINAMSQKMLTVDSVTSKSKKTTVDVPEASIPYKKLTSDVVTQYNTLLEIDLFTPAKATMDAFNNPIFNQMIKMYFVKPGYNKLNGKQTAVELKYVATLNPTIKPIFLYGYKLTKEGKNPGLDAISE